MIRSSTPWAHGACGRSYQQKREREREREKQRQRERERAAGELSDLLRHFARDRGRAEAPFLGGCGFSPQVQVSTESLVSNAPFLPFDIPSCAVFLATLHAAPWLSADAHPEDHALIVLANAPLNAPPLPSPRFAQRPNVELKQPRNLVERQKNPSTIEPAKPAQGHPWPPSF